MLLFHRQCGRRQLGGSKPGELHQHVAHVENRDGNIELRADKSKILFKGTQASLAIMKIWSVP